MKLTADFAQIEAALSPLCHSIAEMGPSYRQLRSVRPLLFQTPEHIVTSPAIGDVIAHSTILHMLFSRACGQLQPPYKVVRRTAEHYLIGSCTDLKRANVKAVCIYVACVCVCSRLDGQWRAIPSGWMNT